MLDGTVYIYFIVKTYLRKLLLIIIYISYNESFDTRNVQGSFSYRNKIFKLHVFHLWAAIDQSV